MIIVKAQGKFVINTTGGEKPATFNGAFHVPEKAHSLVFMSSLCVDNHIGKAVNKKCNVKKDICVVGVVQSAGRTYFVHLQRARVKAMAASMVLGTR